jgi:F-type H+-transporting ATPase subunit a
MRRNTLRNIYIVILLAMLALPATAATQDEPAPTEPINIKELIFGHLADSYEWHIAGHTAIHLPCIVYTQEQGLDVFMSSQIEEGKTYKGYHIDHTSGKIVNAAGVRPLDISITKNVAELLIVAFILCTTILSLAAWYKRHGYKTAPGGFVGMMEALIIFLHVDVAKTSIGHGFERFSPYLITVFLFILTCNLLGLIPVFPGGANVTGNIAVPMVLAFTAWVAVNCFAPKAYFKSIFWPDVPLALKAIPLIPTIEFIGVFTKPFSLTIRLFANILAGHIIILSLTGIIFIMWQQGAVMGNWMGTMLGGAMNVVSVAFCIFMNCLELLVAFVQAYVFTMLTANFIGLAHNE